MKKNIILSIILIAALVFLCCACGSKQTPAPTSAPATSNEPAPTNTPPFQMMNWNPTQQPADPINNGGN
jgi:PBP1b-binding outer membrane lipoprotein LpoB